MSKRLRVHGKQVLNAKEYCLPTNFYLKIKFVVMTTKVVITTNFIFK